MLKLPSVSSRCILPPLRGGCIPELPERLLQADNLRTPHRAHTEMPLLAGGDGVSSSKLR